MKDVKIYGIKNCDTMKKAITFLDETGVMYDFHDYKKLGIDEDALAEAINAHGWENVINRRSATWRKLPEAVRGAMDAEKAVQIARDNPSVIKRPVLTAGGEILLGFDAEEYHRILGRMHE